MKIYMKKGMPIILSILIHAFIISLFLFISGSVIFKHYSDRDVMPVSIEGDPNKKIGDGGTEKKSQKNTGNNAAMNITGTNIINNNIKTNNTGSISGNNSGGGLGSGEGGGIGFGIKNNYMGLVLKRIHSHKYYPIYAKKRGLTGTVKLKFTLKKDGSIKGNIEKLNSSGHEILDDAGIKTIKDSAPFAFFPEEIKEQEINFIVDIDFVL